MYLYLSVDVFHDEYQKQKIWKTLTPVCMQAQILFVNRYFCDYISNVLTPSVHAGTNVWYMCD